MRRKKKEKVIKSPDGQGFKILYVNGEVSPESYQTRRGAQNMIDGKFGSAGGIR